MKDAIITKLPIYKDQTTPGNEGELIEVGDSVDLVIRNDGAAPTIQTVVVTEVALGGKQIGWNNSTTGNLRTEDVIRVHYKHQYNCPGATNYTVTLTEAGAGAALAEVTSIEFGSPPVAYAIGAAETGDPATGITQEFVDELVTKVQAVLGAEGFVTAELTSATVVTMTITALKLKPGTIAVVGLTAGTWTAF